MGYRPTPEARKAARALARATPWGEGEWARAIRVVERAPVAVPLSSVLDVVTRTGGAPLDVARLFVEEAEKVAAAKRAAVEQVPSAGALRRGLRVAAGDRGLARPAGRTGRAG